MVLLSQFLLRLAFGLAFGMAITSPSKVSSGFYRNHLYVTLGLTTLATLLLWQIYPGAAGFAAIAVAGSFFGAAAWLYEAKTLGTGLIWTVATSAFLAALLGAMASLQHITVPSGAAGATDVTTLHLSRLTDLQIASIATSGLVLGLVFAAMLLGHWYLNAPGMELAPLRRLLMVAAIAILAQMAVVGAGLGLEVVHRGNVDVGWLLFVALRWSFGLFGVLGLLWMAWQTLKIPNTQSATGILYVAVIGVFIGELTGLLLSAESLYPL